MSCQKTSQETYEAILKKIKQMEPNWKQLLSDYEIVLGDSTSAQQLHDWLNEYNWDDGFAIPFLLTAHPSCELSTAVHAFWLAEGFHYFEEDWKTGSEHERDWKEFLNFLVPRILSGVYPVGTIPFPSEWKLSRAATLYRQKRPEAFPVPACFYGIGTPWETE